MTYEVQGQWVNMESAPSWRNYFDECQMKACLKSLLLSLIYNILKD